MKYITIAALAGSLTLGALVLVMSTNGNVGPGNSSRHLFVILALFGIMVVAFVGYRIFKTGMQCASNKLSGRAAQASALGFSYEAKGSTEFRRTFCDVPGIPNSGQAKHLMRGSVARRDAIVFEHTYMVYNGTTMMPMSHTILSTQAPNWPEMTITPRSWVARLGRSLGISTGLQLENDEFNRRFKVKASDEDFALTLLSPMMQQFLVEKTNVTWHFTRGRVCLVYGGGLRFDRLERSLRRLETFWSHVAEELDSWQS